MRHFYFKAVKEQERGDKADQIVVDAAFNQAAALAEKVAPYRHPRLATMKLSGNPNAQEIPDDMTAEELRAEILSKIVRLGILPPQLAKLLPEPQRLLEPGSVVHRDKIVPKSGSPRLMEE